MVPIHRDITISRRAALRVAAIGGAGLLIMRPDAAFGAVSPTSIEAVPGGVDAYLAASPTTGITDLAGIHAEYREAAAAFPFELPPGWTFPPESSLRDIQTSSESSETKAVWERGNGAAEAYLFWQTAVATAAYEAHLRGDQTGVDSLLDTLESGFRSDVRRAVLEDPADELIKVDVAAARSGDFASLKRVAID